MRLILLAAFLAVSLLAQTGPPVVLYLVQPTVAVTPPVSPALDFVGMAILVHRFTVDAMIALTISYSDGTSQNHLITIRNTETSPGATWRVGAYIGIRQNVTVSSASFAILTPAASQSAGIAR